MLRLEGSICEDSNKVELATLKKLEDSIAGEHDIEVEEREFVKDTQDAKENLAIEKDDTGVIEKAVAKDNEDDDDDDEKKSITEEDGANVVAEQNGVAEVTEQPVPLDM